VMAGRRAVFAPRAVVARRASLNQLATRVTHAIPILGRQCLNRPFPGTRAPHIWLEPGWSARNGFPSTFQIYRTPMRHTLDSTYRTPFPLSTTHAITAATPSLSETGKAAMSIAELKLCAIPPLHDNPLVNYAQADHEIRDWLYNGTRPPSPKEDVRTCFGTGEVKAIAVFCVTQKLPDALSWLVLQCELDELDLEDCGLGLQGVQMIASWLERCPGKIALNLNGNDIQPDDATVLAAALKSNSTLSSLSINENAIGDIGAVALADALMSNSTLTSLRVAGNDIGDIGVVALAGALMTNSTLTELDTSYNKVGHKGETAIDEIDRRVDVNHLAKPLAAPAAEAFHTLPSWNSKLPLEVGALIVKEMIMLGPGQGDGVQGLESLVYESAIAKQRESDEKG
jgi:hypothetical protein